LAAELPEMVVHRLPGREIGGEIVPWTAGAQHLEDGVEDAAQRVNARSASRRGWRKVMLDALPLRIAQVARIACTHAPERRPLRHSVNLQNPLSRGGAAWPAARARDQQVFKVAADGWVTCRR